jgi:hypothetical protein
MAAPPRMVHNLFGELVLAEPPPPERPVAQGVLFENGLTDEEKRARKVALDHYSKCGKDLFPETPEKAS